MKLTLPLLLIAAGLMLESSVGASDLIPMDMDAPKTPVSAPVMPATSEYLLGPDDVLNIKVFNFSTLTTQVTVMPDGSISAPLLKPFKVAGRTTGQVSDILAKKWKEYVINPAVSVSLQQRRKRSVFVYGSVARPGGADYDASQHVLETIAQVGGVLSNADLSQIVVSHKSGGKETLDLSNPETKGGTDADIVLQENDTVYIPERRTQFTVLGQVGHPGSFDYHDNMTVLDAITLTGGVTDSANLTNAVLTHDGKTTPLDLDALLRRGDLTANIKMAAGDTLLIPAEERTYVFGAVQRPGYYTYQPGDRIIDAINGSGGATKEADITRIKYVHVDRVKNVAVVQDVNLEDFLKRGKLDANLPLQAGDAILISDKKQKFTLHDGLSVLQSFSLLRLIR